MTAAIIGDVADQLDRLRALCVGLPEVDERLNHGEPSWIVRRKTLAQYTERLPAERVSFWCPAPRGAKEAMVATDPDRYYVPRFGGATWVGVYLDVAVNWTEVNELICEAYRLIAPQKLIAAFEEGAGAPPPL